MKNLILLILFALVPNSTALAQEFKQVHDGIEYAQFTRQVKISDKETAPAVVNALRLDLKKVRLDVHHALDAAIGTERTSAIATRHDAFAAVNGGFFRLDKSKFKGNTVGLLQIDGTLISQSHKGGYAVAIYNGKTETEFDFITLYNKGKLIFKNTKIDLDGINHELKDGYNLMLFTPHFGQTTLTSPNVCEIVVRKNRVTEINPNQGNSVIPADGFVISSANQEYVRKLKELQKGDKVRFSKDLWTSENNLLKGKPLVERPPLFFGTRNSNIKLKLEDIVSTHPQLVSNGKVKIIWGATDKERPFILNRHPRTAIAKLKDGKALLVTIDGRQPGVSVGMNLPELAEMLLEMGAMDAMNLDGGGSTTMFLDGKVVNKPSDKEGERAVSDAILVTLRKTK